MGKLGNKALMQEIFEGLSQGDDHLFLEAMAEEMQWIWMGSGQWSKTFNGKAEVIGELWSKVRQTLKPPYKVLAHNFIAGGDYVVVEATGQNSTPDGRLYQNRYCWVCRIVEGKIYELKEYMDTELVTQTFSPRPVEILGEKFLFDFGLNKAVIHFLSEDSLQFTITQKAGLSCQEEETVKIKMIVIRPEVYLVSWKEKNGNVITQVQDFQKLAVHSNWVLPGGELISVTGSISAVGE